jgi:hypothetical protein
MKFRSSMAGFITGVRFYKGAGNSGTHIGSLWSSTGSLLARATFTGESATGWQQVSFDAPVAINAATTYVVSYFAPSGHYALTRPGLATAITNAPLTGLADGADGANGLYFYTSAPAFPTLTAGSGNYWVDVVFNTSAPADKTPPTVASTTPAAGATAADPSAPIKIAFSESVTATTVTSANITLAGPAGAIGAAVAYDAATRTATLTPSSVLAFGTAYTVTVRGGTGGISDLAGNLLASNSTFSFTTTSVNCPCSIWSSSIVPGTPSAADSAAVEVGMRFRSDVSGWVTGVRFYKGPSNTGVHVGTLWSNTGTKLAEVTFTGETATGWQTANFVTPAQISANTTYVIGYYAPKGGYSVDRTFFTSPVAAPPLRALADGFDGASGLYLYGTAPAFPTNTSGSANYWVDLVFQNSQPAPQVDTTPPTVTSTTPSGTSAALSAPITVAFSEPINPATVTSTNVALTGPAGAPVTSAVTYDASTMTATLLPSASLAFATTYTLSIKGGAGGIADTAGNVLAATQIASFTTAPLACPCTIWAPTGVPANPSSADTAAVNVGTKFRSDVAGSVTSIRFYKGAANTGVHIGSLWSSTGQLLAQATFTNETASGWQQADLSTPVAIAANTTYVVSYFAPNGGYASDRPFFNTAVNAPPLHALADGFDGVNGLYLYGAGPLFPTNGANAANYWIDIVFVSP